MGFSLFSGKTVVAVDISTVSINEGLTENRLSNLLRAGSKQDKSVASTAMLHNLTSYKNILNQFYNYGSTSYTYGLPESNLANNKYNIAAVNLVLESLYGPDITTTESFLYRPTIAVWGRWWLQENEGNYDYTANTLLDGGVTWDVVGFSENDEQTEITVLLEDGDDSSTYGPITEYYENDIYYCVEYHFDVAPLVKYTWLYQPSLGTHTTLNTTNTFDTNDLFPIIPIRVDNVNVNTDKTSNLYGTTRQIMTKVKMDINALTTSVTKQLDDDGSLHDVDDLDKISDIFLLFGLNIYGQTKLEQQTAFLIFNTLIDMARVDQTTYDAAVLADGEIPTNTFLVDSATFNYEIVFNHIESATNTGRIADRGEFQIDFFTNASSTSGNGTRLVNDYITIQYQYSESQYTEILVHGLYLTHTVKTVRGERIAEIFIEDYSAGDDLTDGQKNFVIPLAKSYLNTLTAIEADILISRTTHLVVYASDSQYVEWYKSPIFLNFLGFVLKVVGIVMLFWDYTGTTTQALYILAQYLVYQYAVEWVLTLLFETFADSSSETQGVVAILALIISYKATNNIAEMSTADVLLKSVDALSHVTAIHTQVQLELLDQDYTNLLADADEIQDELDAANKFLEVSPISNSSTAIDTYEQPRDFFARTLNTAPGQLTFDQLHGYVDNSLNLEYI